MSVKVLPRIDWRWRLPGVEVRPEPLQRFASRPGCPGLSRPLDLGPEETVEIADS